MVKKTFDHAKFLINSAGSWRRVAILVDDCPAKWWFDMEGKPERPLMTSHAFPELLGKERRSMGVSLTVGVVDMIGPSI